MTEQKDIIDKLADKVDSHDRSLVLVSKAVEDINKNLERFANANETLTKEMVQHWHAQDKLMSKVEIILEGMAKNESRFARVEDAQINGCSSFRNFNDKRNTELKHWEDVKNSILASTEANRQAIVNLASSVSVLVEQVKVANKRIADLEEDADTQRKDFIAWKEGTYKALIGYGFAIVGAIASAVWGIVSK